MSLLRALSPGPLPLLSTPRRGANPNTTHPKAPSWGSPSPSLTSRRYPRRALRPLLPVAAAAGSENPSHTDGGHDAAKPRRGRPRRRKQEAGAPGEAVDAAPDAAFPSTIPRKPRRGRRSEAAAVEDFVRGSLERAFAEIRKQNPEVLEGKEGFLKGRAGDEVGEGGRDDGEGEKGEAVVEEEDPEWPADAEVGWGVRASEYFDKHPIRNVVVDGVEIDWEGELDEGWVKEINCLEWESFAFHPSPLIVLVFERYNRAADNWKLLKELEKAAKVYWSAKDRLPPRTVKIDMNIETDLAYALKVKECPQLLFLRGNRILYREKDMRTADELVQMIAHFYYNAKRPSWVDAAAVAPSH